MSKPIYEIPLTDPDAPPFGTPGAAGALPPQHGELPPDLPVAAPAGVPTDYAHMPPPPAAPTMPAAPAAAAPAPAPVAPAPAAPPAPAPAAATPPPPPAPIPVVGGAHAAPPTQAPIDQRAPEIPGFTPAPILDPVLAPPPSASEPAPLPAPDLAPPVPETIFIDDEHTKAARANADPDLLAALQEVLQSGASDLHVSSGSSPLLRVDGGLRPVTKDKVWDREKVASALHSILSPDQRDRFEEVLELDFAFTLSANARFRVNFYQQRGAIGGAFRLIPTGIKSLEQLGVPEIVGEFSKLPRGLVLVTGPTGSGKSTTLAALIDLVNKTRADHIVTVEDPIEFLHSNQKSLVNQREVGSDTHSFANALKHVLRQDPDVILIGELRDLETISVALTAAETGHLVFATLHTQDAGSTVDRVIDVFPPHQQGQVRTQLAATLQGVVCQTLVKRASGSGRAVATEVMITTPAIANLVREGKTYQIASAMQAGRGSGMHTMDQHLAELVNSGDIAYGAALDKVHDVESFDRLITRRDINVDMAGMGRGKAGH